MIPLSKSQLDWLRALLLRDSGVQSDGTYMPTRMEVWTFRVLYGAGLVSFAYPDQRGFNNVGFYITDRGRRFYGRDTE